MSLITPSATHTRTRTRKNGVHCNNTRGPYSFILCVMYCVWLCAYNTWQFVGGFTSLYYVWCTSNHSVQPTDIRWIEVIILSYLRNSDEKPHWHFSLWLAFPFPILVVIGKVSLESICTVRARAVRTNSVSDTSALQLIVWYAMRHMHRSE